MFPATVSSYYSGDQIKKDEVREHAAHIDERYIQYFGGKTEGKRALGSPRFR